MTTRRNRNTEHGNQDDLTRIKGIGKTRQQWLREKLNVSSLQDLAALSPDKIEAKLKADGQIVSRTTIELWVVQAAQLAGATTPVMSKDAGWKPIASFVVEFQENEVGSVVPERRTKAHHVEADKNQMWSGIEHEELCAWMVQRLSEVVTPLTEQSVDSTIAIESQPAVETAQAAPSRNAPFSEKLQQVLAKAERMGLAAMPSIATGSAFQSSRMTYSNELPGRERSQQLRAVLAKADRLSQLK